MTLDANDVATIISALKESGGVPISVNMMATTEWTQYAIMMGISVISSIFVFIFMWDGYIKPMAGRMYLAYVMWKIKKITGRNAIVVKHTMSGWFDQSMIDMKTLMDLETAIRKFEGKPFDLILHTPGGHVFYAQMLSKALHGYSGNIRALVPFYAMSGGTMLALSCKEIVMGKFACLGAVDPQLGGLFSYGSAASWKEVMRVKGKKASDSSIQNAFVGEQYTQTIRNDTLVLLERWIADSDQRETTADFLTGGNKEHAFQLDIQRLGDLGITATPMNPELQKLLSQIICNNWIEGVSWV